MAKIAKISLVADVGGFRKKVEEAKQMLTSVAQVKIPEAASQKIEKAILGNLEQTAKDLEKAIGGAERGLKKMAMSSGLAFDSAKVAAQSRAIVELQRKLKEVREIQKDINEQGVKGAGAAPQMPTGQPGGGGGGMAGRFLRGGMGGVAQAAGAIGLTVGVGALVQRRIQMANERLAIRQIGGSDIDERSRLGFTTEQRRQRALGIQQAVGRQTTGEELTRLTDMGEKMERAFGVSGEQQTEAMTAGRKAGVQDQSKFLATAIGAATAAGLEGSRVGEYLQAMSGALEEMSQGVNIDTESLNGFAGALSSMPFFKTDPSRAFAAMRGMNQAFKEGDRFQQAMAFRAMAATAGAPGQPMSAGAMEFRRKGGLFQEKMSEGEAARFRNIGADEGFIKLQQMDPTALMGNMIKDVMDTLRGADIGTQAQALMERLNLEPGAARDILLRAREAEKAGKPVESILKQTDIEAAQKGAMDPQERLAKVMEGTEGEVAKFNASVSQITDRMATNIAEPIINLTRTIERLIEALSGSGTPGTSTMGDIGTGAVVGGAAVASGALGAGAKAAGRIGTAVSKGGAGAGVKAAGRMAGKAGGRLAGAIPFIGTLVKAGFAIKDAKDMYENYQKTGRIENRDAAMLLADVVGMIPGVGTVTSLLSAGASIGGEFLDKDSLGGFQVGTPMDKATSNAATGVQTPTEGLPDNVIPFPGQQVAPTTTMPTAMDNTKELSDNTRALLGLTEVINTKKGGVQTEISPRFPSNPHNSMKTGR